MRPQHLRWYGAVTALATCVPYSLSVLVVRFVNHGSTSLLDACFCFTVCEGAAVFGAALSVHNGKWHASLPALGAAAGVVVAGTSVTFAGFRQGAMDLLDLPVPFLACGVPAGAVGALFGWSLAPLKAALLECRSGTRVIGVEGACHALLPALASVALVMPALALGPCVVSLWAIAAYAQSRIENHQRCTNED
jgi:hypothetical protein